MVRKFYGRRIDSPAIMAIKAILKHEVREKGGKHEKKQKQIHNGLNGLNRKKCQVGTPDTTVYFGRLKTCPTITFPLFRINRFTDQQIN